MNSQRGYSQPDATTYKPVKDLLWPETAQDLLWPKLKLIEISLSKKQHLLWLYGRSMGGAVGHRICDTVTNLICLGNNRSKKSCIGNNVTRICKWLDETYLNITDSLIKNKEFS